MPNPFSYVANGLRNYVKELRAAPAAQYVTRAAAPSANPSLTSLPPPAYMPNAEYDAMRKDSKGGLMGSGGADSPAASPPSPAAAKNNDPLPQASYLVPPEKKKGNNIFDRIVNLAGSRWAFLGTLSLLGIWAAAGIINGPSNTWQVVLQDTSSIQCYISATLLMRQQQNATRALLTQICSMISRSEANARMMRQLSPKQLLKLKRSTRRARQDLVSARNQGEGVWDQAANAVAGFLGSLAAVVLYWVGILVWLFVGIPLRFSDTWQLYANTATAIELTFTTVFLQTVRRQHEEHLTQCLRAIDHIDRSIELDLRRMTGTTSPNPVIESTPLHLTRAEKMIDVYAFVVGGTVGVFISTAVAIAWIAMGHPMRFDDNWWLIIGTYTGLVGFMDGFVLRNVDYRETLMADRHFERLLETDARMFALLDVPWPEEGLDGAGSGPSGGAVGGQGGKQGRRSIRARISLAIADACSSVWASLGSVVVVVALLTAASAMHWTETGQLLCNTPTMIFEGFLLLMLIEGHNSADAKRRAQWTDVLGRRLAIERRVSAWDDPDFVLEVEMLEEKMMGFDEKYLAKEERDLVGLEQDEKREPS